MSFLPSFMRRRREPGATMQGETKTPANQLSPDMPLKSIIRKSNLPSADKVKIALKLLKGERVADMCDHLGRGVQHVSVVINGKRESATLKRDIADYLGGLAVEDIFPPQHNPSLPEFGQADQREA